MTTTDSNARLDAIIRPIVQSLDLELVEITLAGHGRKSLLRITIDREGGIGIEDCERVSRMVGHALDVADPMPEGYRLEVSSPGLDRPLKMRSDYMKYRGRLAKITTRLPIDGQTVWVGRLGGVEDDSLHLTVSESKKIRIHLGDIARAHLEVEW
jgi:ribosome maturation factor RimP